MNNNIYTNNNFIGSTHLDGLKPLSNLIISTSNILEQHIAYSNISSSNFTLSTSNILETHLLATSNILETHSSNFTNALRYDVNKWINEEVEHITLPFPVDLTHTYIYNSNILGEIRFTTKGTPKYLSNDNKNYIIRIKENGAFELYYQFNLLYPTVLGGWYNIMDSIRDGYAYQATNAGLLGEIQVSINSTNGQLIALESALGAIAANVELLNGMTVEDIETIISDTISLNLGDVFNNASILGITGLGVLTIITSLLANTIYDQFLTSQLKELAKMNNQNITEAQKTAYMEQIKQKAIENLNQFNIHLRSLNDTNGYINSNIQTQQYIKNLKCETLDLNTGNITNINGIVANELIANGKIKENNKFLDTTYLTSNHLYNLAYTYTAERQYPSKLYNTTSSEDTVSLLGKLVYHQVLYLDNQTIAYGSGIYELYSSSSYDTPTTKNRLFNFNTSETTTSPRWAISLYNSGTGNYQADNSIVSGYFGDWVIIKMPQPILLTRYRIYQRSDFPTKAPAEWKVYGSNDGITFTEITEASQTTRLSSYTSGFYEKSLNPSFTTLYQYIGYTFKSLLSTSGQTDLSFSELQIFGKEIISNTITSNIYATSNAVREIIKNDSIFAKHYGFYITITTPIVINGTTFYKYDIDLRQYTKLGIIQIGPQSGDTFRSFKIRLMYATMYFSYIINDLPNVCYYEVFMSYKNTASPPNGVAGLNACAIGFPPNPTLQTVMPNNLFVVKNGQGDINYITCVSSSPADCRVIVEDLLG